MVSGCEKAFKERAGPLYCTGAATGRADAMSNVAGIISGDRAGEESVLVTGPAVNTSAGPISGGVDSVCSSRDIAAREGMKAGKNPSCASGNSAADIGALTS